MKTIATAIIAGLVVLVARGGAASTQCFNLLDGQLLLPVAVADGAFVYSSAAIAIPVLANDYVASGGSLQITALGESPCGSTQAPAFGTSIPTCAHGTATIVNGNYVSYAPPPLPVSDGFDYSITDVTRPGSTSTAHVQIDVGAQATAAVTCQGVFCRFTVSPTVSSGINGYSWTWGDGSSQTVQGTNAMNHQYPPVTKTYDASVTINYYDGNAVTVAHIAVPVTYKDMSTFTLDCSRGLICVVNVSVDPSSYVGGSATVGVNWSANAADCVPSPSGGTNGCGSGNFLATACVTQCSVSGYGYLHGGTYAAILQIAPRSGTPTNYPFAVSAVNAAPRPKFTSGRTDPNVRAIWFNGRWEDGFTSDDGPYPLTYEWDFGDATSYAGGNAPDGNGLQHTYVAAGTYNVALKVTDADGKSGVVTQPVTVANTPPVAKMTVHCALLDCTFGTESSIDDGNSIASWSWDFGDTTTGLGSKVTKHFNSTGCYTVTVNETDAEGAPSRQSVLVPVGRQVLSPQGRVTVDAHVQSYWGEDLMNAGHWLWLTTNGNLNGIAEPGESLVVEPTWSTAPSLQPVSVGLPYPHQPGPNIYEVGIRDTPASYDVSTGIADCWTAGKCYVLSFPAGLASSHMGSSVRHWDYTFHETNAATLQQTPGSPIVVHLGGTFTDVPSSHWAYAAVESALHAGLDTGCSWDYDHSFAYYCPTSALTRADAARWLMKAEHGGSYQPPLCTTPPFTDVPCSDPNAAWIAQFKAEGLTSGTGGGAYSPAGTLTRAEMAIFLIRTKLGAAFVPPHCGPDFGDVACSGYWAADWISEARTLGISNGCSPTEFCPDDPIDRAQAASQIVKAFGLRIDGKQCPPAADATYDVVPGHPIPQPIVSLTFSPNPALAGTTSTGTITLGAPTATATSIPLTIDVPSAAKIPAAVTVPGGRTVGTFTVTPSVVQARTTATISATYQGVRFPAELVVCTPPPTIAAQPLSRAIGFGQTATLTVTASGGGTLSYQWYQGSGTGTPVGSNNATFVTPALLVTTTYWVKVSSTPCGSTSSSIATVTVCAPISIASQPASQTIASGSTAMLSVAMNGSGPFSYQWFQGTTGTTTTPLGTASTLTTAPLIANASYWVRVTGSCNGTLVLNSNTATVTVVSQITRIQTAAATAQSQTSVTAGWPQATHAGSLLVAVVSANTVQSKEPVITALTSNANTTFTSPGNSFVQLQARSAGSALTTVMNERGILGLVRHDGQPIGAETP